MHRLPLTLVFFASAFVGAPSADALDPVLAHAIEQQKQTVGEAQKYTYTEHLKNINWDSKGKETLNMTDTYEITFLEGAPYKKHVLHNEQPLSDKEQRNENKKIQDIAAARRKGSAQHNLLHAAFHFELPLDQLASSCSISAAGSEQLDGRDTLIFLAVPKPGTDMKQAAKDGVAYEIKLWVDQQDQVLRKADAKVVGEGMRWEKDTLISYEFHKINGEAWLPSRFWFKGKVRYMLHDVPAEDEQIYFAYKKFHAVVKITVPTENQ